MDVLEEQGGREAWPLDAGGQKSSRSQEARHPIQVVFLVCTLFSSSSSECKCWQTMAAPLLAAILSCLDYQVKLSLGMTVK